MDLTTIINGIELVDVALGVLSGTTIVSEILPHIKKVKANSTLQLLWNAVKLMAGKTPAKDLRS